MDHFSVHAAPAVSAPQNTDDAARARSTALLANIGLTFEQFLSRADGADMLTRFTGAKWTAQSLAKIACVRTDGPKFKIVKGRAVYRAGALLSWALAQMQEPADSPQRRGAQTRRERGDTFGRKRRPTQEAVAA
jgi:hypothetical protein